MPARWFLRVTLLLLVAAARPVTADEPRVRPAQCAGDWYPREAGALQTFIDDLLAKAPPPATHKPLALIVPHAGYRFSAPVASAAYAALRGHEYPRVIVLAFSHRQAGRYRGVDVPKDLSAYATPLGDVPIDRPACDRLLKEPLFATHPGVDAAEHSLELQLPFLKRVLKDFRLVPLLVGQMSDTEYAQAAQTLLPLLDEGTLLVASSDFTHFGPNYDYQPFKDDVPAKLRELAEQAAAPLLKADYDGFTAHLKATGDTICGRNPIQLLLRMLSMHGGADGVRAAFDTSGNIINDYVNSVTYKSIVFTPRTGTLPPGDRATLLRLARRTVTAHLNTQPLPAPDPAQLSPALRQKGTCFVTLQNRGALRGCIGNMLAEEPLHQAVVRYAVEACKDYRFVDNPVTAKELDAIDIEISYLTPMQRITKTDEIIVGRHGLHIALGGRRGVLLPQVAYERGWTREQFLQEVCRKAGLPADAWKKPETELQTFEAEVFGEK